MTADGKEDATMLNFNFNSNSNSNSNPNPSSPMKDAADLIEMLDITCTEMNNCAADAARDAETARKNARAASEIARRYMSRSYPKTAESSFGFGITPTSASVAATINIASTPSPRRPRPPPYNIDLESKESSFDEADAFATGLETPGGDNDNTHDATEALSSAERRKGRQVYKTPTSAERIAQSHADDVLTLNIELERARQALKSEQRMHVQTKTALESMRSKNRELKQQKDSLQETVDTELKEGIQSRQALEEELKNAYLRLQAAEEDAQLALDLAKESAEKRDDTEQKLQLAVAELDRLKSSKSPTPSKRSVRFADESPKSPIPTPPPPPPPPPPPRPQDAQLALAPINTAPIDTSSSASNALVPSAPRTITPRSMVAAGRQLLLKRSTGSPEKPGVIKLELTPAKSAEKRKRFRERLEQMGEDAMPSPRRLPSTPRPAPPAPVSEDFERIAQLLKESGQRLDLSGHWWRENDDNDGEEDLHLEAMTRQYCQSVEFKIDRQHKNINELESLCGFLENKLVRGNNQ